MDSADEEDIYREWKKLDHKLTFYYEKEAWKFLPKMDKLVKEKLGWRRKFPEDDFERFQKFMSFIEDVYLRPSLQDDRPSNDSNSSSSSDETYE